MPKKEPEILTEMQQYIIKMKGIPIPASPAMDKDVKWNETTIAMVKKLEHEQRG